MKIDPLTFAAALALFAVMPATAPAQGTFGSSQSLGSSFSPGTRTAFGSGSGLANQASVGQIQGRERFVRANRRPGQFVGADAQDLTTTMRNFSILGGRAARQANLGLRSASAPPQPTARTGTPLPFQAKLEAAFDYPQPNAQATSQRIVEHLKGARGIKSAGPIQVVIQGETAILRGQVGSQHDRALAEQLARLEPGVWQVQNELTVAASKKK